MVAYAEANRELCAAVRNNSSKPAPAERKRGHALLTHVAVALSTHDLRNRDDVWAWESGCDITCMLVNLRACALCPRDLSLLVSWACLAACLKCLHAFSASGLSGSAATMEDSDGGMLSRLGSGKE